MSDLISRREAIDAIRKSASDFSGFMEMEMYTVDDAITAVNTVPSAESVRHGKWIDIDEQTYTWKVRCSCCSYERSMMSTQGKYPNYCEECGARMDSE